MRLANRIANSFPSFFIKYKGVTMRLKECAYFQSASGDVSLFNRPYCWECVYQDQCLPENFQIILVD